MMMMSGGAEFLVDPTGRCVVFQRVLYVGFISWRIARSAWAPWLSERQRHGQMAEAQQLLAACALLVFVCGRQRREASHAPRRVWPSPLAWVELPRAPYGKGSPNYVLTADQKIVSPPNTPHETHHPPRATRTSTVIATVLSRLVTLRPARPRAQALLPPRRRTAVHRAAALGPATSGPSCPLRRFHYVANCEDLHRVGKLACLRVTVTRLAWGPKCVVEGS